MPQPLPTPTPRAPPPTPMSPRYTGSTSSSSSGTSGSSFASSMSSASSASGTGSGTASSSGCPSYTTQEYSYFSPHAPLTGSTPTSPYVHALGSHPSVSSVPHMNNGGSLSSSHQYQNQNHGTGPHTHSSAMPHAHSYSYSQQQQQGHGYGHPQDFTRPIIQGFVTTRGSTAYGQGHGGPYNNTMGQLHTHPPPPSSDVLQQFALHIPGPPTLNMPSKMMARQPSGQATSPTSPTSTSASSSSQHQQQKQAPEMGCRSDPSQHALSVLLPRAISPEMVTISANKGDRLRVVAQAWMGQDESHFEWQISFPPHDVDLSKVQAKFDPDGCLTIRVPRRPRMGR